MGRPEGTEVWVGLGSNLADPARQLRRALASLGRIPATELLARSSLYRSPPMGPPEQPDYVNAVARLATTLGPMDFLDELQAIEVAQGRRRTGQRWGPRTLDLDLLLWGRDRIDLPRLRVPHPGLPERAFVLYPLAELASGLRVPGHGTVADLLPGVDGSGLRRMPENEG